MRQSLHVVRHFFGEIENPTAGFGRECKVVVGKSASQEDLELRPRNEPEEQPPTQKSCCRISVTLIMKRRYQEV